MIRFASQFKFFPGMVHGLQQSGIGGNMFIGDCSDLNRDRLCTFIQKFIRTEDFDFAEHEDNEFWLAHQFAAWVILLQQQYRVIVSERYHLERVVSGDNATEFSFVFPFSIPIEATSVCFNWLGKSIGQIYALDPAAEFPEELIKNTQEELDSLAENLRKYAAQSVNRYYLADAAFKSDIPIRPLRSDSYLLGSGSRSRLISSSVTDVTPALSARFANNKIFTADLLRTAGFPAPLHYLSNSEEQAVEHAENLGYPVVVKPVDSEEGKGVAADLRDKDAVINWYRKARKVSNRILIEKHVEGSTHRLSVFNNQVIKVVKRIAGGVVGDGRNTIAEIVELEQSDERLQRISQLKGMPVLQLDDEAEELLTQQDLNSDSIPALEQFVKLRRRDNSSAGGSVETLSIDEVHEDNLLLAIRAAQLLKLDFAGIDLIISDIRKSWLEIGGVICEINFQPTLGISDTPLLYQQILAEYLPLGARIPVHIAISIPSRRSGQSEFVALQHKLNCQSLSTIEGLWLDHRQISGNFANQFLAARALISNKDVESAICVMEPDEVIKFGIPIDRVDTIQLINPDQCTDEEKEKVEQVLALIGKQANEIHEITTEQSY